MQTRKYLGLDFMYALQPQPFLSLKTFVLTVPGKCCFFVVVFRNSTISTHSGFHLVVSNNLPNALHPDREGGLMTAEFKETGIQDTNSVTLGLFIKRGARKARTGA